MCFVVSFSSDHYIVIQCAKQLAVIYSHANDHAALIRNIYIASCYHILTHKHTLCSFCGIEKIRALLCICFSSQIRTNRNVICHLYSSWCSPSLHPSVPLSQTTAYFHLMLYCTGLTPTCSHRHCGKTIM